MRTMRLAFATIAFVGCGAFAQVPASAPVDADQRAAVKELLDAMNFRQVLSQMGAMMTQQMPQMIDRMIDGFGNSGKLTPEQKTEAREIARRASDNSSRQLIDVYNDPQVVQGLEDIMARAYAKHFTTAEIRATTAFYTSPAGKKTLTVMPQMMQETMPETMAMMAPRMNAMMEKMAKDFVAQVERKKNAKGDTANK